MAKKNVRNMKVCGQSGYKYETVPAITLKGKWLEELGFHLWDYVQVKCENGQLIITPDVNKAQEKAAKTAFMEEEIKKLEIISHFPLSIFHSILYSVQLHTLLQFHSSLSYIWVKF
jgi:toxic protein SymE